jgi:succinoglycan biosynthesis protein ExoA
VSSDVNEITAEKVQQKTLPRLLVVFPRLLVVFPCLNEETYLEPLVMRFVNSLQGWSVRFAIVDGGSSDRSIQIAQILSKEHSQVSFLNNPKHIQSAAINLAVSTFGQDADYLIRIDVHADYPENYCQILIAEAEKQKADSVVVSMKAEGKGFFQKGVAVAQNSLLGNGGSKHRKGDSRGRWIDHGHHALIRIDAFKKISGYDETFSHNEDAEFDFRLCKAGGKIWLTGETAVTYFPRNSPLSLFVQYYHYGFGRARNIKKNKIRLKLRQMIPAFIAPMTLFALFTPFFPFAALPFVLWAGFCLSYGAWLAYSRREPEALLSGAAAMIMHAGWSLGFWRFFLLSKTEQFL